MTLLILSISARLFGQSEALLNKFISSILRAVPDILDREEE